MARPRTPLVWKLLPAFAACLLCAPTASAAPVDGVLADVRTDLNASSKAMTFVVTPSTHADKLQGAKNHVHAGNMLSTHVGEQVVVFPHYGHHDVAAKVDILLGGASAPKPKAHHDHFHSFQMTP